jgi:hypothetical protein
MSSGPIVAAILEKDNAIEDFRKLIGATDPAKAEPRVLSVTCLLNQLMQTPFTGQILTKMQLLKEIFTSQLSRESLQLIHF